VDLLGEAHAGRPTPMTLWRWLGCGVRTDFPTGRAHDPGPESFERPLTTNLPLPVIRTAQAFR